MNASTLVLFDFDGTLVDSIPAVQAATNAVLNAHGYAGNLDTATTIEGMRYQTSDRFGFHSGESDGKLLDRMRSDFYAEHARVSDSIVLRPEMAALVDRLRARGWKTGIVTNNSGERVRAVLGEDATRFDIVIGEFDVGEPKPDPEGITTAIAALGASRFTCAFIGDAPPDAEAGRRAGVYTVGITWLHLKYGLAEPEGFPRLESDADDLERALLRWRAMVPPRISTSPTTLLFMRHCESEANRAGIMASRIDYPLSERGREDAAFIAHTFLSEERVSIDRILVSPLSRARQTAQPFADALGCPVTVTDELEEHELGAFSGMTFAEAAAHPDYRHDKSARWNWKPKGGETYHDIYERLIPLFLRLGSDSGSTTLCVTHAVTMRIIQALLENTVPRYPEPYPGNGEIWIVRFTGIGNDHTIERHHIRTNENPP